MKGRFAILFLLTFTVLVLVWWAIDFGVLYRSAALATVRTVSPAINGWFLEYDLAGKADAVVYRSGNVQLPMLLQLPALSMALLPLLSLIAATPGIGLRRGLLTALLGAGAFFLLHVGIVLLYPVIMDKPNALKDAIGVFSGLLGFVVGPLGLWFVLTYPVLRPLWQLGPPPPR